MTTSIMFPALSTQVHKTKQKSTCCATVHGMRSPNADFPRDKLLIIVCLEISPSKQTYAKYTAIRKNNNHPTMEMHVVHQSLDKTVLK